MNKDQIFDKEGTHKCDILAIMSKAINEQVNEDNTQSFRANRDF